MLPKSGSKFSIQYGEESGVKAIRHDGQRHSTEKRQTRVDCEKRPLEIMFATAFLTWGKMTANWPVAKHGNISLY
jgi:hypothetical protein